MSKQLLALMLALSLILQADLLALQSPGNAPKASAAQAPASSRVSTSSRTENARRKRSYEHESGARRHSRISKQEVAFLAAIAGTSMGIGALAGGPKGLAIGSFVGGWGTYAGHRLWKWVR